MARTFGFSLVSLGDQSGLVMGTYLWGVRVGVRFLVGGGNGALQESYRWVDLFDVEEADWVEAVLARLGCCAHLVWHRGFPVGWWRAHWAGEEW